MTLKDADKRARRELAPYKQILLPHEMGASPDAYVPWVTARQLLAKAYTRGGDPPMPRPKRTPTPLTPEMERLVREAALGTSVLEAVKASGLLAARRRRRRVEPDADTRKQANGQTRPRARTTQPRPRSRPAIRDENERDRLDDNE